MYAGISEMPVHIDIRIYTYIYIYIYRRSMTFSTHTGMSEIVCVQCVCACECVRESVCTKLSEKHDLQHTHMYVSIKVSFLCRSHWSYERSDWI